MVENYYAFGQPLPKWNSKTTDAPFYDPTKYRYGFNGKEDDDEWSKQDYGFRIYDGRIGRFLSVDPLTGSYPWYTPYQFAGNMPIWATDLDGLEPNLTSDQLANIEAGETRSAPLQDDAGNYPNFEQNYNWTYNGNGDWGYTLPEATVHDESTFTKWNEQHSSEYNNLYERYTAWQSDPFYHNGENDFDRTMRMVASSSKEARRDWASGGDMMYGGTAAVEKTAIAVYSSRAAYEAVVVVEEVIPFRNSILSMTKRAGRDGNAVEVLFDNGSKMDITATRVKEWIPNSHPNAPTGTLSKVKFENSLPGSKGFKRTPTLGELDFLYSLFK
jgi:RHS repeat-associated protein